MEKIEVGNALLDSETLNLLHLAVYYEHLDIVKLICDNVLTLDLANDGKIPANSGLVNQSEIALTEIYL